MGRSYKDHTVRVWNLSTGRLEHTLVGHTEAVASVLVSPDGTRIVSCDMGHTVCIWNLASGRLERTITDPTGDINAIAITSDGRRIFLGGQNVSNRDYTLVWDTLP